jgi:hypothetical protein
MEDPVRKIADRSFKRAAHSQSFEAKRARLTIGKIGVTRISRGSPARKRKYKYVLYDLYDLCAYMFLGGDLDEFQTVFEAVVGIEPSSVWQSIVPDNADTVLG